MSAAPRKDRDTDVPAALRHSLGRMLSVADLSALILPQLPWVISVLFGFGYIYSRVESRLETIEIKLVEIREAQKDFVTRSEVQLMRDQAEAVHVSLGQRLDRLERKF